MTQITETKTTGSRFVLLAAPAILVLSGCLNSDDDGSGMDGEIGSGMDGEIGDRIPQSEVAEMIRAMGATTDLQRAVVGTASYSGDVNYVFGIRGGDFDAPDMTSSVSLTADFAQDATAPITGSLNSFMRDGQAMGDTLVLTRSDGIFVDQAYLDEQTESNQ